MHAEAVLTYGVYQIVNFTMLHASRSCASERVGVRMVVSVFENSATLPDFRPITYVKWFNVKNCGRTTKKWEEIWSPGKEKLKNDRAKMSKIR